MSMSDLGDGDEKAAVAKGTELGDPISFEPLIHGESKLDRVTSMLMSLVLGAGIIVSFLYLIWVTNQAYAARVPAGLEMVNYIGPGGGDPSGTAGATETIDTGNAPGEAASNASAEDAHDFDEPSVQATNSGVLDTMAEKIDSDTGEGAEVSATVTGGANASGRPASKIGTGGIGLGPGGPGDGGYPAEQRWVITYPPGQRVEDYARQLDALKVELGTIKSGNSMIFATNFTGTPITRTLLVSVVNAERRLSFSYAGGGRKAHDIELLQKAGIKVGPTGLVLQWYPAAIEQQLANLEYKFKGRRPPEIKRTHFSVVPSGSGFTFVVASQEPLAK